MVELNVEDIMKLLPHRYPFLMVDRIIECDDEKRIVGIKNVTANEPQFTGHFPGMPVMPGVLQLEAMAQTAGVLLNRVQDLSRGVPFFMSIDKAKFRKVIVPGDQMRIEVELTNLRSRTCRFNAKVYVDGKVASEAEMMCALMGKEKSE